jgi:hypothetical protein
MENWQNNSGKEKQKDSEKTLSQSHLFHNKSHVDFPGREPESSWWKSGV